MRWSYATGTVADVTPFPRGLRGPSARADGRPSEIAEQAAGTGRVDLCVLGPAVTGQGARRTVSHQRLWDHLSPHPWPVRLPPSLLACAPAWPSPASFPPPELEFLRLPGHPGQQPWALSQEALGTSQVLFEQLQETSKTCPTVSLNPVTCGRPAAQRLSNTTWQPGFDQ